MRKKYADTSARLLTAKNLRNEGRSLSYISKKTGVSKSTLHRRLQDGKERT